MKKNKEEYFLAEYLLKNKDKLEKVLGIRIKELNLNKDKENGRVGIEGESNAGEKIFAKLHLEEGNYSDFIIEVQDVIVCAELEKDTKVVCIVINLDEEIIEELMQDAIFFREKQIELIFLTVNKAVMNILKEISGHSDEKLKLLERIFLEKRGMRIYNQKF